MYDYGQGVIQNYQEAVKWYEKSASQGNNYAKAYLGRMYYHGFGVEKNLLQASKLIEEVIIHMKSRAEEGCIKAQYIVGWMYQYGQGVMQDHREAASWYKKSANAYPAAQKALDDLNHAS
jgi:TPR repeat protein